MCKMVLRLGWSKSLGLRRLIAGACLSLGGLMAVAAAPAGTELDWRFVHNGPESSEDQRYEYHWRVLRAALEATRVSHGGYVLESVAHMNESRQLLEMQKPGGLINTLVLDSTVSLEQRLLPVKVPVEKGLLGYRVFLIRAPEQALFSQVRTLDQLRRFSMGQQADWDDVEIYRAAGFKVVGASSYKALFAMLMSRRFDALGRGVIEVEAELAANRSRFPDMALEQDLLLHYPLAVYFWFPRTDIGRRYHARVELGMRQIAADGTLDRLFRQEFGDLVERLQLNKRRLFEIANPLLPHDLGADKPAWWFDPGR
ncbi:hypothetical protein [Paucibacter soli]|uniref:hypothetical protein n=1 Tax=Paucibacter soli TaxID=3133433 RepID=UPI0030B01EED